MKKQTLLLTMIIMFLLGAKTAYSQGGGWAEKKNMSVAKAVMSVGVVNGIIYAIGGSLDAYASTSDVEAYNPATDSWVTKANLPRQLCGTTACTVNDKIYVIGGATAISGTGNVSASVFAYDPLSDFWTMKSTIPTPLMCAAADVVNGKIYIIGGCPFGFTSAYKSVYEYNPATDTWKKKSDMPTARFLASATAVDGKIYVFGGMSNITGAGFSAVEVYDPSADTWAVKGLMPIPRCTHASSAVNGKIYIFTGGLRMGTIYNDVLEYNPTFDTWAPRTSIPTPRAGPAACSFGGKTYIIGGMDNSNTRLSTVEEYDPALDITSVGESDDAGWPAEFSLYQNYPNPFNPSTTISYSLPKTGYVSLRIFNALGQEVALLVNEHMEAGYYQATWNATVPSGIYFYRLQAGEFIETKKMIVLR